MSCADGGKADVILFENKAISQIVYLPESRYRTQNGEELHWQL